MRVGFLAASPSPERLGRTVQACQQAAVLHGLGLPRRSAGWKERIARTSRGHRRSPATEFKRGQIRGQAARNWRPVGFVHVRVEKRRLRRRWIKVREGGPHRHRWIPLARWLWEHEHGPVPAGSFVVHRDGDTMNDDLSNLSLTTRRELPGWQETVRPNMERKRLERCRAAQVRRWRDFRRLKAARTAKSEAMEMLQHEAVSA